MQVPEASIHARIHTFPWSGGGWSYPTLCVPSVEDDASTVVSHLGEPLPRVTVTCTEKTEQSAITAIYCLNFWSRIISRQQLCLSSLGGLCFNAAWLNLGSFVSLSVSLPSFSPSFSSSLPSFPLCLSLQVSLPFLVSLFYTCIVSPYTMIFVCMFLQWNCF